MLFQTRFVEYLNDVLFYILMAISKNSPKKLSVLTLHVLCEIVFYFSKNRIFITATFKIEKYKFFSLEDIDKILVR